MDNEAGVVPVESGVILKHNEGAALSSKAEKQVGQLANERLREDILHRVLTLDKAGLYKKSNPVPLVQGGDESPGGLGNVIPEGTLNEKGIPVHVQTGSRG